MKSIYKILIAIIILAILIISTILIINYDNKRILQSVEYDIPHYSISRKDNQIITVEYTKNRSPKIVTTYSYSDGKLTQREMQFVCENKIAAKQVFEGLDNNNKFSIEKVIIDRNIVTSTLLEENISTYEAEYANLSMDILYDTLINNFEARGCQRIQ